MDGKPVAVGFAKVAFTSSGLGMRGRAGRPPGFAVHDDLFARALVAEAPAGAFAVLALDHAGLEQSEFAELRERVARETGIAPGRFVTFSSHTHSDFDDWDREALYARLVEAVRAARRDARPAEVAYLEADAGPGVNMNRRVRVPGVGAFCIMYNNGCAFEGNRLNCTANVREQCEGLGIDWAALGAPGPYYCDRPDDRAIHALLFREPGGRPLGAFARFSAHWCVVSPRHDHIGNTISADYPGVLARRVEEALGGVCLFGNGPCGDVRVMYRENTFDETERVGGLLAGKVVGAASGARFEPLRRAEFRHACIEYPVTGLFPPTVEEAERRVAAAREGITAEEKGGRNPRGLKRLYDDLAFYSSKLRLLKRGARDEAFVQECLAGKLSRDLSAAFFNDAGFVGLPGEVFTRIGAEIRERSGRKSFFVVSLAGGAVPYQPTADEVELGAYEVKERIVETGADRLVIERALELCR